MRRGSVAIGRLDPGEVAANFSLSMEDLLIADACGSQRIIPNGVRLRQYCSTMGLPAGRNEIARNFLDNTECEWLWMVDSDMGFAPDTVDRLVSYADQYTRPVIGGLCFQLKGQGMGDLYVHKFKIQPTLFSFHELEDEVGFAPILDYPKDQLVEVAGTGAACLMIHRRALEKVRGRYGDEWFDPITHPKGPTTFSEDLSFCVRVAAVELPLFVHTGVRTSHHKGGLDLTEAEFEARRPVCV